MGKMEGLWEKPFFFPFDTKKELNSKTFSSTEADQQGGE